MVSIVRCDLSCIAENVVVVGLFWNIHGGDVFDGKEWMRLLHNELKKVKSVCSCGENVMRI